jgi:ferredoxin
VFDLGDDAKVRVSPFTVADLDVVRSAVDACPTGALELIED